MINVGFISKAAEVKPFIIEIEMPTIGTYTLGLLGNNELEIDWGDGLVQQTTQDNPTHNYELSGRYTIKCSGKSSRMFFANQSRLSAVKQWGTNKWSTIDSAFYNCKNLSISALDAPNLSQVTGLYMMFGYTTIVSGNLGKWDVSNITNLGSMFFMAQSFNEDLSQWDVSNVTNMYLMFFNASFFNQDISKWNVSSVSNMKKMLSGTKLTPDKYDKLLIAWDKPARTNPNTPFSNPNIYKQFGISTTYCKGEIARQSLIDNYGFGYGGYLNDKGKDCPESETN